MRGERVARKFVCRRRKSDRRLALGQRSAARPRRSRPNSRWRHESFGRGLSRSPRPRPRCRPGCRASSVGDRDRPRWRPSRLRRWCGCRRRLPPSAIASVSGIRGCTRSTPIPKVSANCMAMDVRVPPMSGDDSSMVTEPSPLRRAVADEVPPPLPQKPEATPRPHSRPSRCETGACQWLVVWATRSCSLFPISLKRVPLGRRSPSPDALRRRNASGSIPSVSHSSSIRPLHGERRLRRARRAKRLRLGLVDDHVVAVHPEILKPVGRKAAIGPAAHGRTWERPRPRNAFPAAPP